MSNVFGTPVTNETVQEIYIGINPADITPRHRAEVALRYMNADDRANNARNHASWLKGRYGQGTSTLGYIYNATGGNLSLEHEMSWEGNVWRDPYPLLLQNGQWGAFLHVRYSLMGLSKGGILYRGRNNAGQLRDWVLSWRTDRRHFQNRVYTEIRASGSVNWDVVDRNLNTNNPLHTVTALGCYSNVSVGAGSSPHFRAVMTLEGLNIGPLAADISAIFPSLDSEHNDDEGEEDEATPAAAAAAPAPPPAE